MCTFLIIVFLILGAAAFLYFNWASIVVRYHNWRAKVAAAKANAAIARGDTPAAEIALNDQRVAEAKAGDAAATGLRRNSVQPTVSGTPLGKK